MVALCHRFSQRFFQFSGFLCLVVLRLLPARLLEQRCRCLNLYTYDHKMRIPRINEAASDCGCERHSMSRFSPGSMTPDEQLVRFAFHPVHFNPKRNTIKPSIFSHAETAGCSVQRDGQATTDELVRFVRNFLTVGEDRIWRGVLIGTCASLRAITLPATGKQAICVYDTAEKRNPAHAEFGWSNIGSEPGDANERRAQLWEAFGNGQLVSPGQYRGGELRRRLPPDLRNRM